MQIRPTQPTSKGPPERFTGDAWFDMMVTGVEPSRIRSSIVYFAPGARNAWHVHAVGQTLYVMDGVGRVQARGGEVLEIRPGDVVHTPPAEWHWHGASPDRFMTHLTIYEAAEKGPESEWGDHVGDAEYLATPANGAQR
jgi:quercetin dioxygenase-like cupin family protein